ncbi:hypothetical protein DMENIID0001_155660 [Sergentomyia squamirostris]
MKCFSTVFVALFAISSVSADNWVALGDSEPGEVLLGFTTDNTEPTEEPQQHILTIEMNAELGSRITFAYIDIFPTWHAITFPSPLIPDGKVLLTTNGTTQLVADIYYYGFPPGTPEADLFADEIIPQGYETVYNDEAQVESDATLNTDQTDFTD